MPSYVSGLMNPMQAEALDEAIEMAKTDPSYLSSISGGGPVEKFEDAFAKAVGAKYALALSSCTAALHTALMAHGIGPGDEVIVSPYTWGQSVAPVLFIGATAVFADVDPNTCTLDPNSVAERISDKTRAIIPVHIFGIPAEMDSICKLAREYGIAVISDAAQAFGALSKGRKLGGLGDVACYSLGRGKVVCGGEGGVLVTNNQQQYENAIEISQHPLRIFREICSSADDFADELNWNYRIHPIAAVLALADLKNAKKRLSHRKRIFEIMAKEIEGVDQIEILDRYPGDKPSAYGVALSYVNKSGKLGSRNLFIESWQKKEINIQIGPIGKPIHLRAAFQNHQKICFTVAFHESHKIGSCPVAEYRCENQELFFSAVSMDLCTIECILFIINRSVLLS